MQPSLSGRKRVIVYTVLCLCLILTCYRLLQDQRVETEIRDDSRKPQKNTERPNTVKFPVKKEPPAKFALNRDTAVWDSENSLDAETDQGETMDPPELSSIELIDVRVETAVGKSVTIMLRGDAPQDIRELIFSIVEEPLNGDLSAPVEVRNSYYLPGRVASVKYRPNKQFVGTDGFAFEACSRDDPGHCGVGTATIFVDHPSPVARNLSVTTDFNQPIDIDFANLAKRVTILQGPDYGTLTDPKGRLVPTGQAISGRLLYTPEFSFSGVDVITYGVTKDGVEHSAEVKITVTTQDNCVASGREQNCATDLSFR